MRLTALMLGLAALVAALPMTALADDGVRERSPLTVERRSDARPLPESSTSRTEKPLHSGFTDRGISGRFDSGRSSAGIVFGHRGHDTHVSVRFGYPVARPTACRYIAGYHTYETRYVVVPGYYAEHVIPARFGDRWDPYQRCYVRVRLAPRRIVRTWVPERREARQVRVFVPSKWVCDSSRRKHSHDDCGRGDHHDRHDRHDSRHDKGNDRYDRHDNRNDRYDRHDRRGGRY